ncbi:MAG: hypothetical protein Q8882_06575 [Bacillota bacterium]|nr:hypothetical protein [Bacillota bacterium]
MINYNKKYSKNVVEEKEEAEKKFQEEETKRAIGRLEAQKKKQKAAFLCALIGFLLGIIYIIWISNSQNYALASGKTLYEAYLSYLPFPAYVMDFVPPIAIGTVFALIASKKQKGKIYFVLTTLFTMTIIIGFFMLFISWMTK